MADQESLSPRRPGTTASGGLIDAVPEPRQAMMIGMPPPDPPTPRAVRMLRALVLAVAVGAGAGLGAVKGFGLGLTWWIHVLYPDGLAAPNPFVIPGFIVGMLAAAGGAVAGGSSAGVTVWLLARLWERRRLRGGTGPGAKESRADDDG
jgi:hypothetical protein